MRFISRMFGKKVETIESLAKNIVEMSIGCGQTFAHDMMKNDEGNQKLGDLS